MPPSCPYPSEVPWQIIHGLPADSTIDIEIVQLQLTGAAEAPGGPLGGTQSTFGGQFVLPMHGTGALAGFNRIIPVPIGIGLMASAPRTLGDPEQSFATRMSRLFGQISGGGDPDFDLLRITAGTDYGLPSPGHTTLTRLPSGDWSVDSFFDITYRIDFVGAPGSVLDGMSGSTTGAARVYIKSKLPKCSPICPPGSKCKRNIVGVPGGLQVCCDCVPDQPSVCPLASPLCTDLQEQQCLSTDPNKACFPKDVFIVSQNPPQIFAEACSCYNTFECGPVHVDPIGSPGAPPTDYQFSCSGACPPGAPGVCEVFVNGQPAGVTTINASQLPAGSLVNCDCDDTPPPEVCPLANDYCANRLSDCITDDPTTGFCWPRAITGDVFVEVFECDCFGNECGPVRINPAADGGFIYSCPGPCPNPNEPCQIFLDGVPTGQQGIHSFNVTPGVVVTCDCAPPGDPDEGCCLPDGTCANMPPADCLAQGGTPQGAGTACGGVPEACCLPDGTCQMVDRLCCDDLGGTLSPGVTCAGTIEACCLPDNTCILSDPACCSARGGIPQGPGSACLGDSNGDGFDDLCVPPPNEFCPLASPLCQNLQSQCVSTDPNKACFPKDVFIVSQNPPQIFAEACSCYNTFECGPVFVDPIGPPGAPPADYQFSCSGACPPGAPGVCEVFVNGQPAGVTTINASQLPAGSLVSCNCDDTPPPEVCPPANNYCDNRPNDCITDDPTTSFCWPRAITGDVFVEVFECDCFGNECGPIQIIPDPTGAGFFYRCPGPCPDPNQPCQIFLDGVPTGQQGIHSFNVTPGVVVTCDCASPDKPEGCCLPDGSCVNILVSDCIAQGGVPQGVGSSCTGVAEACCLPDGTCTMLDRLCCDDLGGTPAPGATCAPAEEACCLQDNTCIMADPLCCQLQGGTPQGPGSACLGDSNGDGFDDLCVPPDICPLASPLCTNLQTTQCVSTDPNKYCFPKFVYVTSQQPPRIEAEACDCFNTFECGPVHVDPIGSPPTDYVLNCSGFCPAGASGPCEVFVNGQPSGVSTVNASQLPVVAVVSCDCNDTQPPCPLGTDYCANLQATDCVSTSGVAEQCWPRAITGDVNPQVFACDCFVNECGPVHIDPDPTGAGFIYSCPEPCPAADERCVIHLDNAPTGAPNIHSFNVTPGVIVTCDCAPAGEPDEGCCLPDGTCVNIPSADCIAQGGVPQGAGSACTGIVEACCLPDGTCKMLDRLCCDDIGGISTPGATCAPAQEACCFPDGSCTMADPTCCQLQGGTPQGSGSACLGDNDGDGRDDLCVPPADVCPLASPLCANLQFSQCQSTAPDEACFPKFVYVPSQNPPDVVAEACSCFHEGECGPVFVDPIGQPGAPPTDYQLTCSGICPPGVPGPCEVFINGQPSGVTTIMASQVPAGSVVSCDCDDTQDVCPLGTDWCANLRFTDCITDDPAASICWPQAVGSDAAGGPNVLACDCFGDECGPVRIDVDPTGQGYVYSCPGPCPDPLDRCEIHFDDGNGPKGTGLISVNSFNVPAGVVVTCDCPVCTPGDANGDGKIDLLDFFIFQKCFMQPPVGICKCLDMDGDGDIDVKDLKAFVTALTGP
jgi:hypothetical protein